MPCTKEISKHNTNVCDCDEHRSMSDIQENQVNFALKAIRVAFDKSVDGEYDIIVYPCINKPFDHAYEFRENTYGKGFRVEVSTHGKMWSSRNWTASVSTVDPLPKDV